MSVIAQFINTHNVPLYKTINAISRAKIIDDAFHFMMERQFNVSVFWNLTRYLSADTDYVAWYPMIKIFEYMSTIVPFSVEEVKYIDIKVMTNKYYLTNVLSSYIVNYSSISNCNIFPNEKIQLRFLLLYFEIK